MRKGRKSVKCLSPYKRASIPRLVIPAHRKLRQEDAELQANLGYTVRLLPQKKKERKKETKIIKYECSGFLSFKIILFVVCGG
jgi:hypothetical protein